MAPGPGLPEPVMAALKRGNKVEAIKLLRAHSGIGLKEAKDAVEASGIQPESNSVPGEVPPNAGLWRIVVVVLLLLAAWYFLR